MELPSSLPVRPPDRLFGPSLSRHFIHTEASLHPGAACPHTPLDSHTQAHTHTCRHSHNTSLASIWLASLDSPVEPRTQARQSGLPLPRTYGPCRDGMIAVPLTPSAAAGTDASPRANARSAPPRPRAACSHRRHFARVVSLMFSFIFLRS